MSILTNLEIHILKKYDLNRPELLYCVLLKTGSEILKNLHVNNEIFDHHQWHKLIFTLYGTDTRFQEYFKGFDVTF